MRGSIGRGRPRRARRYGCPAARQPYPSPNPIPDNRTYLDGKWIDSDSGKLIAVKDPQTDAAAYHVQACSTDEVDRAFVGARSAQQEWARTPLWKRAKLLRDTAALLRQHCAPMAECLVREVAKPRKEAVTEVVRSADLLEYCAEEGVRRLGKGDLHLSDAFPGADRTKLCLAQRVPLGVVLCIPPFNYPVNLCVSKLGPALVAGNSVVVKPPTQGAVAGLHLARCFEMAGAPPGLIQFTTGSGATIGDYLTAHPGVNCISFTGGDTGLSIARKTGMVPLQMELGGKDACLVLPDADLDLAVSSIVKGGFSYSGQRCTAVKLVLIVDTADGTFGDELVRRVREGVAKLTVGRPEDDCTVVPVVSRSSADFIQGLVEDAAAQGADLGGEFQREGNLIRPLLIDKVTKAMRLCHEEPFGPVLPVVRCASTEEAVELANSSRFGLQGCVFTRDIEQGIRVSDALQTGTVQVNAPPARGPDHFPFQGFKTSGIGSQGIPNSIDLMTKVKSTVLNLATASYTQGI